MRAAFTVLRLIRGVLLSIFSIGYFFVALYSLIPLWEIAFSGSGDLPAGILLLTQIVFVVQGRVFGRYPSAVPPEKAEWAWVPEFRRVVLEYSDTKEYESEFRDPPMILEDIKEKLGNLRQDILPQHEETDVESNELEEGD